MTMTIDDPGNTVVAFLEIKMRRNGMMSIGGSITDEEYILKMIDTARVTLMENFQRNREGKVIVPAYDTALVGTPQEKKLIKAIDDLHKANEIAGSK
jgi:hypothetical protein